jgi:hypothetical protein
VDTNIRIIPFYDTDEFVIQDALSTRAAHSTIQYLHDNCARNMEVSSGHCLDLNIMWNVWVGLKRESVLCEKKHRRLWATLSRRIQ